MLFEARIEVYGADVVVLGSGVFSDIGVLALRRVGANVVELRVKPDGTFDPRYAERILAKADALLVMEHHSRRMLIGPGGCLAGSDLAKINPGLTVVHIAGGTDRNDLVAAGFSCCPDIFSEPGHMSVTTAEVGPRPLINLHLAGLKVGEIMARARRSGLSVDAAEREALGHPLCQGFVRHGDA